MLSKEELSRYNRHLILPGFGLQGQEKLKQSKVLVIGAGGLGCPVLLYLTAAGVGEIGIIDFDTVEESNLQRQILFSQDDIGKSKAEAAGKKLAKQNPHINFNIYSIRLHTYNALEIFEHYDVIIDGTDNFATRYLVNDACVLLGKPLVYGAIYKFEGQVSVFNYATTAPTYRCLFPLPPAAGSVANCSEIGVLGVLPGIVGMLQATEAIKIITGIGTVLSGKILLVDALSMNFLSVDLSRNENAWKTTAPATPDEFLGKDYDFFCGNKSASDVNKITAVELQQIIDNKNEIQLLDVREPNEQPLVKELTDLQIPLDEIQNYVNEISKTKKVIVFCKGGTRSKRAIELLEKEFAFTNLYNLEGGVMEWIKHNQTEIK